MSHLPPIYHKIRGLQMWSVFFPQNHSKFFTSTFLHLIKFSKCKMFHDFLGMFHLLPFTPKSFLFLLGIIICMFYFSLSPFSYRISICIFYVSLFRCRLSVLMTNEIYEDTWSQLPNSIYPHFPLIYPLIWT
jgi:hypothetical protein